MLNILGSVPGALENIGCDGATGDCSNAILNAACLANGLLENGFDACLVLLNLVFFVTTPTRFKRARSSFWLTSRFRFFAGKNCNILSLNALRPNATLTFSGARGDSRVNDEGGPTSLNQVIHRYHIPHLALEAFVR